MRISDWSSDVCSSDLVVAQPDVRAALLARWPLHPVLDGGGRQYRHLSRLRLGRPAAAADDLTGDRYRRQLFARRLQDRVRKRSLGRAAALCDGRERRSEEHTSELQSLMRISYAVFCLKK